MIHMDLFSGIGGFAVAVDEVWPGSEHIFCEIDPYCRASLKKRFEGSAIYEDIKKLTTDPASEQNRRIQQRGILANIGTENKPIITNADGRIHEEKISRKGKRRIRNKIVKDVFQLTGGFPCQPFSQAGKRRGTEDDRHLWPQMLRVIEITKPRWLIAENVRGIVNIQNGLVFEQVCADLEAIGYKVQPFIIPAVAVNAPHRRDRVWIIGHNDKRWNKRTEQKIQNRKQSAVAAGNNSNAADSKRSFRTQQRNDAGIWGNGERISWERPWVEVASELCGVDDGLPAELDGLKLSAAGHRRERLKALGNAIVPAVAVEIMRAIKYAEGK